MEKLYDLIIVGGGPGGIASAVEASFFGVKKILLIEKVTTTHRLSDSTTKMPKEWTETGRDRI